MVRMKNKTMPLSVQRKLIFSVIYHLPKGDLPHLAPCYLRIKNARFKLEEPYFKACVRSMIF